jgi:hypothetical protein
VRARARRLRCIVLVVLWRACVRLLLLVSRSIIRHPHQSIDDDDDDNNNNNASSASRL